LSLAKHLKPVFLEIVKEEKLDDAIASQLGTVYLPLSEWIANKHTTRTVVIGVNGAQGSGKSTLCKIIRSLLVHGYKKKVIMLSIDDLYYSKEKREELSRSVHPLLKTRGVPGTHDVDLGINIFKSLTRCDQKDEVVLPVFDKAIDDLLPRSEWASVKGPVDISLFEGWCVGSTGQGITDLQVEMNRLEREEDKEKIWRTYVNNQLLGPYQELFSYIDYLVLLEVPCMESIFKWRSLQEEKLKQACKKTGMSTDNLMSEGEIERFIMHFERITQHILKTMPGKADIVLKINKNHHIYDISKKE